MSSADAAAARLPTSASASVSISAPTPINSPASMPMPPWLCTIRNILSHLSKTVLEDSQLSDLHITLEDECEYTTRLSVETTSVTDAFLSSSEYHGDVKCFPRHYQNRPEAVKALSESTACYFVRWIADLGYKHSENRTKFRRTDEALRITRDTRTKGVKTVMTACDMENGHSLAVLIRNRRQHEGQLNSAELYALLALADEQRLRRPSSSLFEVHVMVAYTHWIQRLSVQVPLPFLISIIDGKSELLGNLHIHRTPWFNFLEEEGRRGALQAVFEHFPLKIISTIPDMSEWVAQRLLDCENKQIVQTPQPQRRRTRRNRSYITTTSSIRSRDILVTPVDRNT